MWHQQSAVRITHLPTGLSARSNEAMGRSGRHVAFRQLHLHARALLVAKLAKLREDPEWRDGYHALKPHVRSYHVHPPLGIPPFARNNGSDVLHPVDGELFDGGPSLDRLMLDRRRVMASALNGGVATK